MGRAKLNMELISNPNSRKTTFRKRKDGLKKKARELSVLCGVDVGLIIYGPNHDDRPESPDIWPADPSKIRELINSYRTQRNEDRVKRTFDLSTFFDDRKRKAEESLVKLRRKNDEAKFPTWDDRYNNLTEGQLMEFSELLDGKLESARARVELMKVNRKWTCSDIVPAPAMVPTPLMIENPYDDPIQNSYSFVTQRLKLEAVIHQQEPLSSYNFQNEIAPPVCFQATHFDPYTPRVGPIFYDPLSMYYCGPAAQPMPQFMHYPAPIAGSSTQLQASPMDDYFEFSDFQMKNSK